MEFVRVILSCLQRNVTYEYHEENGICFGKAFDNRLGCFCIIGTMKALMAEEEDWQPESWGRLPRRKRWEPEGPQ